MSFSAATMLIRDPLGKRWLEFTQPRRILATHSHRHVLELLQEAQSFRQSGAWIAGMVSYDAAAGMDAALTARHDRDFPLVWLGVYHSPRVLEDLPVRTSEAEPTDWHSSIDALTYRNAIDAIRGYIAAGDTYQVNFSYRLRCRWECDTLAWFTRRAAAAPYAAYLDMDRWQAASLSPELFFQWRDGILQTRPMKGTAPRGLSWSADRRAARALARSAKNRAENAMIVDMARHDLGRIAPVGSVRVAQAFALEKLPYVWQMTSTVAASCEDSLPRIFQALFPAASITGAPKRRTMELIGQLEDSPRKLYCGAIGFAEPNDAESRGRMQFNVAIRTLLVDRATSTAEYGVGGGIVWDSTPQEEYAETLAKAGVFAQPPAAFELLESVLWQPGKGSYLLHGHLRRMKHSAEYFDFPFNRAAAINALRAVGEKCNQPSKLRLLLSRHGRFSCTAHALSPRRDEPLRLTLATQPIDRQQVWFYHKTTVRHIYEQSAGRVGGFDEIVLYNEQSELTEARTANIVVQLGGRRYTPPVRCGLLAGVLRRRLLRRGLVKVRALTLDDLAKAEKIWLVNSVQKVRLGQMMRQSA